MKAPAATAPAAARLTRTQLFGYGALGLPLAFAALPVYVYAPTFYAGLGLSLAMSGLILLAARLADAFIDPWLGAWSDRVQQRKRFIACFLLPLGAGMVALFHPPAAGGVWLALWLGACLAAVYAGFSAANIAYQAWGARMTHGAHERTAVSASREGFGLAGVVLASLLPQTLAPAGVNAATIESGLPLTSLAFLLVLTLGAVVTLTLAPDGKAAKIRSRSHSSGGLQLVLASVRMRRLLLVFALNGIASAIAATLFLFFVADVLQVPAWSGRFLALYFAAAACALPLWAQVARRAGKRVAWLASMLLAVAAFGWAFWLGPGDTLAFALICTASGAALGADLVLPPSILADVIERDGADGREGAYFGVWNLVTKLNLALAAGLVLPALQWAGYRPGAAAQNVAEAAASVASANAASAVASMLPMTSVSTLAPVAALALAYCLVPCTLKLCAAGLLLTSDFNR